MSGLFIIILILIAGKILFGRDVKGGIDDHIIWTHSPVTTGLKGFFRIVIVFIILAFLLSCCAGM